MTTEVRCEKHDMVLTACVDCRPGARPVQTGIRDADYGPAFSARWSGTCAAGDHPFPAGTSIRAVDGDEHRYVCTDCVP